MKPISIEAVVPAELFAALEDIARRRLCIATLRERHSDRLDFHDVGVSGLCCALYEAYRLGVQLAQARQTDST